MTHFKTIDTATFTGADLMTAKRESERRCAQAALARYAQEIVSHLARDTRHERRRHRLALVRERLSSRKVQFIMTKIAMELQGRTCGWRANVNLSMPPQKQLTTRRHEPSRAMSAKRPQATRSLIRCFTRGRRRAPRSSGRHRKHPFHLP